MYVLSKSVFPHLLHYYIIFVGHLTVNTTALPEDCVVTRMANLVEEAQKNKSKTQRIVDKFTKYYTPC